MKKIIFIIGFFFLINVGYAKTQDIYSFPTSSQQQQFTKLSTELRCLVCQNENLADSSAPLAADLRNQIADMVLQNKTNQEIVDYMVSRYGEFILFKPRKSGVTLIVWVVPFLLLFIGLIILFFRIKFTKSTSKKSNQDELLKAEKWLL